MDPAATMMLSNAGAGKDGVAVMNGKIVAESPSAASSVPSISSETKAETNATTNNGKDAKGNESSKPKANGKKKEADNLDLMWICTECNEAECDADRDADLMICEGQCNRPFHYPCANLTSPPPSDETWVCDDCQKGRHRCAFCEEYGADNEQVFCCDKEGCGLFFHESCLSMHNVEIQIVPDASPSSDCGDEDMDVDAAITGKPRFICPAHACWTCTEDYVPPEDDGQDEKSTATKKNQKGKGGRKKKNRASSSFATKRESKLYRCLHCPIAYHLTCIPPLARFHELALLCHNHAGTHKLPDLDTEYSLQAQVEAKISKKEATAKKRVSVQPQNGEEINHFFPGVQGDDFVANEDRLLLHLQTEAPDHQYLVEGLPFCLPIDVKNEVHSKPPSYQHVHSNQYDKSNRPKRKPPSDGKCECKAKVLEVCDDTCLNRTLYQECVGDVSKAKGDKNPYWNCDLGPACTNRSLGRKKFAKCKPMREQGKGWGLITVTGVKKGELVQEYVGEIIDEQEKEKRLQEWTREHPNDPNFYVMALDSGWFIDARIKANLSRFINHSCAPNCRLLPLNVNGYMRVGIFSLRDIAPGEFLSYDYQFDTKHGDKFGCRCGAENCRGTMKGGKGEDGALEQKTRKEEWQDAKASYDRDVKYLEEAEQIEKEGSSQVDYLVPGADNPTEAVAAGPNEKKYRETAWSNRLFLWRNVVLGDVSDRPPSLSGKRKRRSSPEKLPDVDLMSTLFKSNEEDS